MRSMLGPPNDCVRPVVNKLCVPVFAWSVLFVNVVPVPRGTQPSVVPSSKFVDKTVWAAADPQASKTASASVKRSENERREDIMVFPENQLFATLQVP